MNRPSSPGCGLSTVEFMVQSWPLWPPSAAHWRAWGRPCPPWACTPSCSLWRLHLWYLQSIRKRWNGYFSSRKMLKHLGFYLFISPKCSSIPRQSRFRSSPTSWRLRSSCFLTLRPNTWTWTRPALWPGGCEASPCCCWCTGVQNQPDLKTYHM